MPALHIRDVPEETVRVLKSRAARSGQSLQAHLRQLLLDEAGSPTCAELADHARSIAEHSRVTEDDIVEALAAGRKRLGV